MCPLARTFAGLSLLALAGVAGGCQTPDFPGEVWPRGHTELRRQGEELFPLFWQPDRGVGWCVSARDASSLEGYRARLSLAGRKSSWLEPTARLGEIACFQLPQEMAQAATHDRPLELCGSLADREGNTLRLPCFRVVLANPPAELATLRSERAQLLSRAAQVRIAELVPDFEALATRARADFPLLAAQLELTLLHFLERDGDPASLELARARLASLPPWLDHDVAEWLGPLAFYQRARIWAASGDPAAARQALRQADARYRRLIYPRLPTSMMLANLLAEAGAVEEGRKVLARALDECPDLGCERDPAMLRAAQANAAFLTLLDAGAAAEDLRQAVAAISQSLVGEEDQLERASRYIDLAAAQLRLGEAAEATLVAARRHLAAAPVGERRAHLTAWADFVEAELGIVGGPGPAARAAERCRAWSHHPRHGARAASCLGRLARTQGDLAAAARHFADALAEGPAASSGANALAGIAPRAEDFGRAARVAIERGDAAGAWEWLERLDREALDHEARRVCRERPDLSDEDRQRWRQIDQNLQTSLEALARAQMPATLDQEQVMQEAIGRHKEAIRRWWSERPGCPQSRAAAVYQLAPDVEWLRAWALDDEVVVLRRVGGVTSLWRRRAWSRLELLATLRRLEGAGEPDPASPAVPSPAVPSPVVPGSWRREVAELAAVLAPPPGRSPVVYSLHGPLQAVPLSALVGDREGYWGVERDIRRHPAQAVAGHLGESATARPLFLVDPERNLPSAAEMARWYRATFSGAEVVQGQAATRQRLFAALEGASFLHLDAHAVFDPVAPQLSSLFLADGPVHWLELADRSAVLGLANLSGCATGRWPISADSGAYGLAGLLSRQGTRWVVASRLPLPDAVAASYNRAFYQALAQGHGVPAAHRLALAQVAEAFAPHQWGFLMLLEALPAAGGQNARHSTPQGDEAR